ncbi:MAG TPA: M3 family oligoendopeptidase [Clostridia bacterium]|nr:M3 family oligoendopeptidase [Clostridia bacterium]
MKFSQMEYKQVDFPSYQEKSQKILSQFRNSASAAEQVDSLGQFYRLEDEYVTMSSLSYIRNSVNTADPFYAKEKEYYDENGPKFEALSMNFYKALVDSPYRAELTEKLGPLLFQNAEIALKSFDDRLIGDMAEENRLKTQYTNLIASASIKFAGKTLNLSQLGYYMNSSERETRKSAYAARTEFFLKNERELDDIYDKLVKLRDKMAKKLGYKNYIELGYLRMMRNSYKPEDVAAFRQSVKEKIVPLTRRLHEKQRQRLGLDQLMYYDEKTLFPGGNPLPHGTPEEIFQNGKKMYHEMSRQTGEFIDFMIGNGLFDVLGRANKAAGGYCIALPDYQSPFIFANFNGTHDDINVLTHEAGHAFEFYLARDVYPAYREPTNDAAEIHSMSMEFFCWPWTPLFFGNKAEQYHYLHLFEAIVFIPYGCAIDEFQHIVYQNPEMTPAERRQAWKKLEEAYLPHLNFGGDPFFGNGGTFLRQLHVFEYPFYYIDYCLAQTCALEFWEMSRKEKSAAWEKYLKLCRMAGTKVFNGLVAGAGLRSPFDPACVDSIAKTVEGWFDSFDESLLQ